MTEPTEIRAPVDAHPLLGMLPERERDRLASGAARLSFHPGQAICREGAASSSFFLLVDGRARVTRTRPNGSQEQVASLERTALFGLVGVMDGQRRSTTIAALTPCVCLSFPRGVLAVTDGDRALRLREILAAAMNEQLRVENLRLTGLVGDRAAAEVTLSGGWRLPAIEQGDA